jgi:hypothetical protein
MKEAAFSFVDSVDVAKNCLEKRSIRAKNGGVERSFSRETDDESQLLGGD